ncbi:uncharacterized protein [Nicotiana tomentosiformis]|uniref:uncharacterized protein n=1 Tax=Nicotiana tomentosiformis TaxID=4098 RepID=UPI00388C460E
MNEDQKLIHFLMELNEGYSGVRGNILMMKPLPSTAQAYSIILHEESQREVHSGHHVSAEPSAFNVKAQKTNSECRGGNYNSNTEARKNNFCFNCKKHGHQKEKYYKLVGYPPSFKFTKPKINFGNVQANASIIEEGETLGGGDGNISTSGSDANASANFAPSMKRKMVLGEAFVGLYVLEVDSNKSRVSNEPLFPFPKNHVKTCSASNLESFVQSCSSAPESIQTFVRGIFPSNESLKMNKTVVSDSMNSNRLWHLRLGHLPYHAMKNIKNISLSSTDKQVFHCDICPMARQSKLPFPTSSISSKQCFELLHIDTWSPYNVPTYKGEIFSYYSKVKIIRSDNAYELGTGITPSDFFTFKGIVHHISCIGNPQQNGPVFLSLMRECIFFSSQQESNSPNSTTRGVISLSSSNPRGKDCPIVTLSTSRVESALADGLRRSSREHNAPKYLSDYICDAAYSVISPNPPFTPFHSYSFSALSLPNQ